MNSPTRYDVVIAGGGPAAVTAAILLGRRKRKVLLCDASCSELDSLHKLDRLPGRDSCCTSEFLRAGRSHLTRLDTVFRIRNSVYDIDREKTGFSIICDKGGVSHTSCLLLASDHVERLPDIREIKRFFGVSVHQCPYCEGWEYHEKNIGVIGNDEIAVGICLKLLMWTPRVTLYTHGPKLPQVVARRLAGKRVEVVTGSMRSLEGHGNRLEFVRMENGTSYPCNALFLSPDVKSHLNLAHRLGCSIDRSFPLSPWLPDGGTGIQGLFFMGTPEATLEMAVTAAAEGVRTAEEIDRWLTEADLSYLAPCSSINETGPFYSSASG